MYNLKTFFALLLSFLLAQNIGISQDREADMSIMSGDLELSFNLSTRTF